MRKVKFDEIVGKTCILAQISKDKDEIHFDFSDGSKYRMFHNQDCCEKVLVEDIVGDLDDLVGVRIFQAYETSNFVERDKEGRTDGSTYTFYTILTMKNSITIRWCGTSNGYYSESVDFERID